jgi:parallel beta-helix repeat protein
VGIQSNNNTIRHIQVVNFPKDGIALGNWADGNLIVDCLVSGNGDSGIDIDDGSSNNRVQGCRIGTDAAGVTAWPNMSDAVRIRDGASNNLIGGVNASPGAACTGECNLISGNAQSGVGIHDADVLSNTVIGNYIGTDISGTSPLGNGFNGIFVTGGAKYTTITNNVVSGNSWMGIEIGESETSDNTVTGNYIGVDATGTTSVGNAKHGILIRAGASNNIIGGTTSAARNVISANNDGPGISLEGPNTTANVIVGNYIGTDGSGAVALGNAHGGIAISNQATDNRIGGSTPGERNLISGNLNNGISIRDSGTVRNVVSGNYIGANATGTGTVANQGSGVNISDGASNNQVGGLNSTPGGSCSGECNLISGNGGGMGSGGVWIQGANTSNNVVSGNHIGVNAIGSEPLPNNWDGVFIGNGATDNRVGGATPAERNIISGNQRVGVSINGQGSGTSDNKILGNYIGINASANAAVPNGASNNYTAVEVYYSAQNMIRNNIIAGNQSAGIVVQGDSSRNNVIAGNRIGATADGAGALGNSQDGVRIGNGASQNVIGGINSTPDSGCSGDCNLIIGNGGDGIAIVGEDVYSNTVTGNFIGVDLSGLHALGNNSSGLFIGAAAHGNVIGGATAGLRNLISGNLWSGIAIGGGAYENRVLGNYIGSDVTGLAALGNGFGDGSHSGVALFEGAHHNRVGGPGAGEGNLLSATDVVGVSIYDDAHHNVVQGNRIGTDITGANPMPNTWSGIYVGSGAAHNLIGGAAAGQPNVIAHHPAYGISISGATTLYNSIRRNSIFANVLNGIEFFDGGNLAFFPPVLNDVTARTVSGQASPNSIVEIFSDAGNQGRKFEGATTANSAGIFTYAQAIDFTYANVTATATDADGNTSKFSGAYAPVKDAAVAVLFEPNANLLLNQPIQPRVKVSNPGTTAATNITVQLQTPGLAGVQGAAADAYSDSQTIAELAPLAYQIVTFAPFTPQTLGLLNFQVSVAMAGDQDASNNSLTRQVAVKDGRVDVWVHDNSADVGRVPTYNWWQSPDIWVRNQADGLTDVSHQQPISGTQNYVYVEVQNRGSITATDTTVKVYWHEPSLGIACGGWALIGEQPVVALGIDAKQVVSVPWTPTRGGHTCLFAVLESAQDPVSDQCDVGWDNNIAQRNVEIVDANLVRSADGMATGDIHFTVGNINPRASLVDVLVDRTAAPANATLLLDLGADLFARWQKANGGAPLEGATLAAGSTLTITAASLARIRNLPLAAHESALLTLTLTTPTATAAQVKIYAEIDGTVIGGNTYRTETYVEVETLFLPVVRR